MAEHTVGEESVSTEDIDAAAARVAKTLGKHREPLFSVISHPDGGFQSRFLFDAIGTCALGPQRKTAKECVEDCERALVGLLGQLGIDPEDCSITLVQVRGLGTADTEPPESAT